MTRPSFQSAPFGFSRLPAALDQLRARMCRRLAAGPVAAVTRPGIGRDAARRRVDASAGTGYRWVAEVDVDPIVRRAAGEGRDGASSALALSRPPVVAWFREAAPGESPDFALRNRVRGFTCAGSGTIAIAADQSPAQAREAAAHEVRHVAGGDEPTSHAYGRGFTDAPVDVWSRR
jgi:hypothetical protein